MLLISMETSKKKKKYMIHEKSTYIYLLKTVWDIICKVWYLQYLQGYNVLSTDVSL